MTLRLALIQINPTVGDLAGNQELMDAAVRKLRDAQPDLVVFPELAVTGYPPEDLLGYRRFLDDASSAVDGLARAHPETRILVGAPVLEGDRLYNAAILLHRGSRAHTYRKCTLPNYGVFDEKRYFEPGRRCPVLRFGEHAIGVSICEDIWVPGGVPKIQAENGATILINISASPYAAGKVEERARLVRHRAIEHGVTLAYLNIVGGQDELVFDGGSLVYDAAGRLLARGRRFCEDAILLDIDSGSVPAETALDEEPFVQPRYEGIEEIEDELRPEIVDLGSLDRADRVALEARSPLEEPSYDEEVYRALVLGTRDYVRKNQFREVVIGLSGGIDSALTAVIASDALGPKKVHAITMPGPYTSESSLAGARALAANLGISLIEAPIHDLLVAYRESVVRLLQTESLGVTEENIQARIRGNLLMAWSNYHGGLVLTTGNKSEVSVGYCTLYGDMAGGFAVIKDLPKLLVYRLARWRNAAGPGTDVIPEDTLARVPSAELSPGQKDSDSLPPYPILDQILEARIEHEEPPDALVARGFDAETVRKVYAWIDRSEYKRRQAPPGIKISTRAFGKDRRYPITNRYRPA